MSQSPPSDLYPMRVVTRTTGLAADTIRAWERRYGAVEPHRTEGNARRYSGGHIRKLTLLRDLTSQGHSISSIAKLDIPGLEKLANATLGIGEPIALTEESEATVLLDSYLQAVRRFDTKRATESLHRVAGLMDNRTLVFDLVLPIVRHVGHQWAASTLSVAEEHLVSAELSSLLSSRAQRLTSRVGAPRLVLATPAGHHHAFGILASRLLAAERGVDVVYLGTDVPTVDLEIAVRASVPVAVTLGISRSLTANDTASLDTALRVLTPLTEVWLGCPPNTPVFEGKHRVFHTLEAFDVACDALAG